MRAASVVIALALTLPAADLSHVTAEARAEDGLLTITLPTPGTVTRDLAKQLKNGLTHRVRYTLSLRPENDPAVLLSEVLTTEVVFDLWEEAFVVSHSEAGLLRRSRVRTEDKVKAILERPRFRTAFPVGNLEPNRRYVVDVKVEVNPVSQEVLDRTRKMLSPPPGDGETSAARSFLGSVARIFVNESSTSTGSEALFFRSHAFPPPARGAP